MMGSAPASRHRPAPIPPRRPCGGPTFFRFDDNLLYEILVDNDADVVEDVRNTSTFLYNTGTITSLDPARPAANQPHLRPVSAGIGHAGVIWTIARAI
jgi:hypothetical protein